MKMDDEIGELSKPAFEDDTSWVSMWQARTWAIKRFQTETQAVATLAQMMWEREIKVRHKVFADGRFLGAVGRYIPNSTQQRLGTNFAQNVFEYPGFGKLLTHEFWRISDNLEKDQRHWVWERGLIVVTRRETEQKYAYFAAAYDSQLYLPDLEVAHIAPLRLPQIRDTGPGRKLGPHFGPWMGELLHRVFNGHVPSEPQIEPIVHAVNEAIAEYRFAYPETPPNVREIELSTIRPYVTAAIEHWQARQHGKICGNSHR